MTAELQLSVASNFETLNGIASVKVSIPFMFMFRLSGASGLLKLAPKRGFEFLSELWIYAATFLTSLIVSLVFVAWPALLMNREHLLRDLTARQSTHTKPTPRVGGFGIILAVALGSVYWIGQLGSDLVVSLGAGVIVFLAGLREDITRDVSPRARLLAAFLSAALAIALTGVLVPDLGLVPGILLYWYVPAVAITLLWSAGTCHALNLIDGLNGLSSLYTISAAFGLFMIAGYTGDEDIQIVAGLLIAAVFGFFVLNWPMGRIFLGDAGAYGIGHILAWLGIVLVARNPSVAGFAILLILFWPVCDTLFSIVRRLRTKQATDQPDRLHFHHLALRVFKLKARRNRSRQFANPIAAAILVPFFSLPIATGVFLWDQPVAAAFALAAYIALFIGTYTKSVRHLISNRYHRQK